MHDLLSHAGLEQNAAIIAAKRAKIQEAPFLRQDSVFLVPAKCLTGPKRYVTLPDKMNDNSFIAEITSISSR
jgi:hypothetical protein